MEKRPTGMGGIDRKRGSTGVKEGALVKGLHGIQIRLTLPAFALAAVHLDAGGDPHLDWDWISAEDPGNAL